MVQQQNRGDATHETLSKVQCPECDDLVRKHRRAVATQAVGGLPISPDVAIRRWRFGDDVARLRKRLATAF